MARQRQWSLQALGENAVKYYLFFREYLQKNYPQYKALVAFSGDKEIDGESYSEAGLNGFSELYMLKDEFKKDKYRFLIVETDLKGL